MDIPSTSKDIQDETDLVVSPSSMLRGLLQICGGKLKYEIIPIKHSDGQLSHTCRLIILNTLITTMENAGTEQEAKDAAAQTALDRIYTAAPDAPINRNTSLPRVGSQVVKNVLRFFDSKQVAQQPVKMLIEVCLVLCWPFPGYVQEKADKRWFVTHCTLLGHKQTGHGPTRSISKTNAALKMWKVLYKADDESLECKESSVVRQNRRQRYLNIRKKRLDVITTEEKERAVQFYDGIQRITGVKVSRLHTTLLGDENTDVVMILEEIAEEQHFNVEYVDLPEETSDGKKQVLLQLTTLPVTVFIGNGMTQQKAKGQAARSALEYLRILTDP